MTGLRMVLGLVLAIAVANYGVLAATTAHAHDHKGAHSLHIATKISGDSLGHDHGHHHDHYAATADQHADQEGAVGDDTQPITANPELIASVGDSLPAPEHTETGFHTHSAPQIGPQEAVFVLAREQTAERLTAPHPDSVRPQGGERPPLRPPRILL